MDTLLSVILLSPAPALQSARTDKMRIKSEKSLTALMEEHLVSRVAFVSANPALQTLLRSNTTVSLRDTQTYCARAHGRCWATKDVYLIQPVSFRSPGLCRGTSVLHAVSRP